jgi:hypothetical protein
VGPFGLCNGTFDDDVINLLIIIMMLFLSVEVSVRTSSYCKNCVVCRESVGLLQRFLDLRWRSWIGFGFDLRGGIIWHGVYDLWHQ